MRRGLFEKGEEEDEKEEEDEEEKGEGEERGKEEDKGIEDAVREGKGLRTMWGPF